MTEKVVDILTCLRFEGRYCSWSRDSSCGAIWLDASGKYCCTCFGGRWLEFQRSGPGVASADVGRPIRLAGCVKEYGS
jgi:hypothetical protein